MAAGTYWPDKAAAWNPGTRIYPRYSPSYSLSCSPGYKSKIVLERVNEDSPGYASYPSLSRDVALSVPRRPFGYIDSCKPPVVPVPVTSPVQLMETIDTQKFGAPVRSFNSRAYRILGYLISTLAILSFAFELADLIVALVALSRCSNSGFSDYLLKIPWFFSWIAPGIWASIPIFATGILAIYVKDNYGRQFKALAIISSLSAFVFAPAILAINAAEVGTFQAAWGNNQSDQCLEKVDQPTKIALSAMLIVIGIILMLILWYLTIILCYAYEYSEAGKHVVFATEESARPSAAAFDSSPILVPVAGTDYSPTLPPPLPREYSTGVPGRVIYMEAHNRGHAYANTPGYFTTGPTAATNDTGFYWK